MGEEQSLLPSVHLYTRFSTAVFTVLFSSENACSAHGSLRCKPVIFLFFTADSGQQRVKQGRAVDYQIRTRMNNVFAESPSFRRLMPRALLERLPYFLTIHVDVAVLCVCVLLRAAKQRKGPYLQISLTSLVSV